MTNDRSATARWVAATLERFEGPLIGYAARLTGNREQARDVVQDVFLALCRQDPAALDGRLAAWLYRVCRNRALDVLRDERRMALVTELTEIPTTDGPDPPVSADGMLDALGQLPARQQEVLRLKFQAGLSYREIAGVTGLTTGNVGFIIHTGLLALRPSLQSSGSETEARSRTRA